MVRTLLRKLSPISPGRGPFVRYKRQNRGERRSLWGKKRNFVLSVSLLLDLLPFFLLLRASFLPDGFLPGDELYSRSRYENVTPRASGKVRSRIYSSGDTGGELAVDARALVSFGYFLSFLSYNLSTQVHIINRELLYYSSKNLIPQFEIERYINFVYCLHITYSGVSFWIYLLYSLTAYNLIIGPLAPDKINY